MAVRWMHAFIDVPTGAVETAREFWSAVTGWPAGPDWEGHPEFTSLRPPAGAPYVHIQAIGGPPRVHLDLLGDLERDTERLEQLGARRQHRDQWWYVLASPAGLPFCVCTESYPHKRPGATTWPDGHRSRVVQLCVDVPAASYVAELAFWQDATGWADEPVNAPEFHRLVHRSESPLQLLVQRLGSDDRDRNARAHLDIGTDDMAAEVDRIRNLGATVIGSSGGITILRDPVGLPLCVTGNDPGDGQPAADLGRS